MQNLLGFILMFTAFFTIFVGMFYLGVSLLSYPWRYDRVYKIKRKWYESDSEHGYIPMATYGLWKRLNIWFDLIDTVYAYRIDAETIIKRDFNFCLDKKNGRKTRKKTVSFKYDTRPTILCVVGSSGSGKSTVARILSKEWNAKLITSYTTRSKRSSEIKDEAEGKPLDHIFISTEEFNTFKKRDMLAHTVYAGNHYCCLKKDVGLCNVYVIDSDGLDYLREKFSDKYNIKTLLVTASKKDKLDRGVSKSRIARDSYHPITQKEWDFVIVNNGTMEDLVNQTYPVGAGCFKDVVRRYGE